MQYHSSFHHIDSRSDYRDEHFSRPREDDLHIELQPVDGVDAARKQYIWFYISADLDPY